jgi:hypothetical protein
VHGCKAGRQPIVGTTVNFLVSPSLGRLHSIRCFKTGAAGHFWPSALPVIWRRLAGGWQAVTQRLAKFFTLPTFKSEILHHQHFTTLI